MQKDEVYNENDFTLDEDHKKTQVSFSAPTETVQYDFIKPTNMTKKSSNIKFIFFIIVLLIIVIGVYLFIQKKDDLSFMNVKSKDELENISNKKRLDSKDEKLNIDKDIDKDNKEKNLKKNEEEKSHKKEEKKDIKNIMEVKKDKKDIKVCICTQARNEKKYIKEFVEFYEKIGVDKIFIYDNNQKKGEKYDDILKDYIKKEFVEIKDWRGKKKELLHMMDNCYRKNKKDYDWLIFYSPDEYIHLKNYTNIKNFLSEKKFDKCKKVYLNWIYHTDNNLFHYNNTSLQKRFPQIENKPIDKAYLPHNYVKTIIRGNLKDIKINNMYKLVKTIDGCNGYGEKVILKDLYMEKQDFSNYYIDKYFSKSVDEFIDKLNADDMLMENDKTAKINLFDNYFGFNDMSIEKIKYIQKKTKLNLKGYIDLLKPAKTQEVKNITNKPIVPIERTKLNITTNKNAINQSLLNRNVLTKNLTNKNIPNQNIVNKNIPNQNSINKNITNQNSINKNIPNQNLVNKNIPNQNPVNKNIPNQNLVKKI